MFACEAVAFSRSRFVAFLPLLVKRRMPLVAQRAVLLVGVGVLLQVCASVSDEAFDVLVSQFEGVEFADVQITEQGRSPFRDSVIPTEELLND